MSSGNDTRLLPAQFLGHSGILARTEDSGCDDGSVSVVTHHALTMSEQ